MGLALGWKRGVSRPLLLKVFLVGRSCTGAEEEFFEYEMSSGREDRTVVLNEIMDG